MWPRFCIQSKYCDLPGCYVRHTQPRTPIFTTQIVFFYPLSNSSAWWILLTCVSYRNKGTALRLLQQAVIDGGSVRIMIATGLPLEESQQRTQGPDGRRQRRQRQQRQQRLPLLQANQSCLLTWIFTGGGGCMCPFLSDVKKLRRFFGTQRRRDGVRQQCSHPHGAVHAVAGAPAPPCRYTTHCSPVRCQPAISASVRSTVCMFFRPFVYFCLFRNIQPMF